MTDSISLNLFSNLDYSFLDEEDCLELSDSSLEEDNSLTEDVSRKFDESIDFISLE